jgi:alpha-tubulin suppressor-like RCC1 family protein
MALQNIVQVVVGDTVSLALDADGTVWTWGDNTHGGAGLVGGDYYRQPVAIPGLPPMSAIATGSGTSLGLTGDGSVWAWGGGTFGLRGDGRDSGDAFAPVRIEALSNVKQIAIGTYDAFALLGDGTVWGWGQSTDLGAGVTDWSTHLPMAIPGLSDVESISASGQSAFALKHDGTVWGWGDNEHAQLGTELGGAVAIVGSPTQMRISGVASVAAGDGFTLLMLSDGTVWACGDNSHGQLGDGTLVVDPWPAQVPGLSDIVQVATGDGTGYALGGDGTVWAWGDNSMRQIGDGTSIDRPRPVTVVGLSGIAAVAAGNGAAFAIQS